MMPGLRTGDFIVASRWDFGFSPKSFISSAHAYPHIGLKTPRRGDVIIFNKDDDKNINYVKRVIGLPGDSIRMIEGQLFINEIAAYDELTGVFTTPETDKQKCVVVKDIVDQRISEGLSTYCKFDQYIETLPDAEQFNILNIANTYSDDFDLITVPKDHIFVLGDNRDDSLDSRFSPEDGGVGFIPITNILGKVRFVIGRDQYGNKFFGNRPIE